jgi:hypothetical protein
LNEADQIKFAFAGQQPFAARFVELLVGRQMSGTIVQLRVTDETWRDSSDFGGARARTRDVQSVHADAERRIADPVNEPARVTETIDAGEGKEFQEGAQPELPRTLGEIPHAIHMSGPFLVVYDNAQSARAHACCRFESGLQTRDGNASIDLEATSQRDEQPSRCRILANAPAQAAISDNIVRVIRVAGMGAHAEHDGITAKLMCQSNGLQWIEAGRSGVVERYQAPHLCHVSKPCICAMPARRERARRFERIPPKSLSDRYACFILQALLSFVP